jgi:hypothetical protein
LLFSIRISSRSKAIFMGEPLFSSIKNKFGLLLA